MPYANIVYAKLEKRLLNDPRFYMLSETSQLVFVKLILTACETYNKIPTKMKILKRAFRSNQQEKTLAKSIEEIKINFPKFKEGKRFYYFEDFQEKTNWIAPRELPRNSQGIAKGATEEDKEEDKDIYRGNQAFKGKVCTALEASFNTLWAEYPNKDGRKSAFNHFKASIKGGATPERIQKAIKNYKDHIKANKKEKYTKNGSTFFNNWEDWENRETEVVEPYEPPDFTGRGRKEWSTKKALTNG